MKILLVVFTAFSLLLSGAENLLKNPSFEDGLEGWSNPGWLKNLILPQIDKTVFAGGQTSLRILGEPGKVGNVHQAVKIPEGTKELTFAGQIKTSGIPRGWCASIHLDCYGAGNKRMKTFVKGTSWEKPENEWTLFGDCVQLPEGTLSVDVALRVHNANTYKGTPDNAGCAWFDELGVYAGNVSEVLLKKESTTKVVLQSVEPEKIGGVFLPGEEIVIKCKYDKDGRTANYAVVDFFGKTVLNGRVDNAGAIKFSAPKKNGYYVVKVSLTDGQYGEKTGSFIVAEKVESPDPFFAMCHHYISFEFLPAARALGYGSMTVPVLVYKVEPQPGKYVFEHPDQWLELVEKLGMKPNGFFSFSGRSSWALPAWQNKQMPEMMKNGYTEEYFQQVRNFVHATLKHYGTRIDSWMHSGEINLGRSLSPYYEDRYLRVLQIVHSEVKACNSDIKVISLGVAGVGYPEYAYLKSVLPKALPYLDVVGPDWYITPYVYGPGYRPVSEEKGGFREQIIDVKKLVQGKRLSIEEKGYGYAAGMPFDHQALKDNAAVAQRGMIIAKAHGIMHWVPHNGVAKKEGRNYNMGMWMNNNPRPILASTATIARLLAHADDALECHPSPEIWGYVFLKNGRSVAAIWQSSSKPVIETSLKLPDDAICYDIMGNVCSFDGQISNYPIFVESSEEQKAFAERLNKSTYQLPQYAVEYQFASDCEIRLVFRNLSGNDLKMEVSNPDVDSRTFIIPAGEGNSLHTEAFKLKKAVDSDYRSFFTMRNNGEKRTLPVVLNALPVTRLKDVKLDGTLQSFAGVKPIVMDSSNYLLPVDAAPNGLWTGKNDLSAKIYLGHDDKKFYIGVEVTDDQWFFTQSGSMLWNQDAIEISIDPLNNALSDEMKTRGYDADDFDFSFGQSSNGPATWCHLHPIKSNSGARADLTPVIRKKDENTMVIEFAVAWEELGITPASGRVFGFNLGVFDREAATGGTSYNMSLSSGTTNGKDPSCYRKFVIKD